MISGLLAMMLAHGGEVDPWLDAVVWIQQGGTQCAGVRISPAGTVATAYHCVAVGGRPRVVDRGGRAAIGRILRVDVRHDLALIEVDAPGPWLPLAAIPPDIGDPVRALGHPLGSEAASGFFAGTLSWSASSGEVSAVGIRSLQLDVAVNPGNSGGPVVDDRGQVVGIVSRRLGGEGLAYAGRADAVDALLQEDGSGLGPFGGTLGGGLVLTSLDTPTGGLSVGARIEVAVRDRIVVSGMAAIPMAQRWGAARFGSAEGIRGEARGALRQRIGRGPWAARLDLFGSVAWVDRLTADPADPFDLTRTSPIRGFVGLEIGMRSVRFGIGLPVDGLLGSVSVAAVDWPGVVAVF